MFQQVKRFFRRLFSSRGFHRGTRILLWVLIAYIIYNFVLFLIAVMDTGVSFTEALQVFFGLSPFYDGYILPSTSLFLGIGIGLILYFRRRRNSLKTEEEKPVQESNPVQEEELPKTEHFQYH